MAVNNELVKADINALLKKVGDKAQEVARQLAISLQRSIISQSPVDTGRFRNNWVCGINAVNTATTEAVDKTGADALNRTKSTLQHFKMGDTVYLTNSLPYAQRLEYGWSKQAPAGFVRITVVELEQYLKKVIAELK